MLLALKVVKSDIKKNHHATFIKVLSKSLIYYLVKGTFINDVTYYLV